MTIFKEIVDEEYITVSETKEILQDLEMERAAQEREMHYVLARSIQHANRFAVLDADEAQELVAELRDHEKVDEATAYKIADLLPRDRQELRTVYAQQRYSLSGEELDGILRTLAQYVEVTGIEAEA
ncbi:DNA-directed RNA polymerase subunit F [Halobacteriales archaeon QS_8_69_26]|nr:MAG: DNA-directed RNA polymerase subunit F [Halobacteriales archaeon QS_8_69_26]